MRNFYKIICTDTRKAILDAKKTLNFGYEFSAPLTQADINAAYRAAARQSHPDRNQNDANANERMETLSSAKNILLAHVKKEALISSSDIQMAIQDGLFDAAALENIHDVEKLEYLLQPEYIQAFRDNVLSFSDMVNLDTVMLQSMLDFQCLQSIRNGLLTFDSIRAYQTPEDLSRHIRVAKLSDCGFNTHFRIFTNRYAALYDTCETEKNKITISQLYNTLYQAKQDFLNADTIETAQDTFIAVCRQAINTAIPELEEPSAWKPILLNMLNALVALLTLGIANLVYGTFRLFEMPVPGLEDEIQNVMTSLENLP